MRVIVCGASGRMGKKLISLIENGYNGATLAAAVDIVKEDTPNFYTDIADVTEESDVIIDFSHPSAFEGILDYAKARKIPLVIAATGHTEAQREAAKAASTEIPVFMSGNMSIGVALVCEFAKKAAALFPDADVEIVEVHHRNKIDVPSGTALMLANAVRDARGGELNIGRSDNGKRKNGEIGIHSLRTGAVIGEHEVRIDTGSETITLKHQSHGRELFGEGALCAASFISVLDSGFYTISDMIGRKC